MSSLSRLFRSARMLVAVGAVATVALVGCEDDTTDPATKAGTFFGDSTEVGDGVARSFVILDADGNPTDIGLRITADAMNNLPDTGIGTMYSIDLPNEANATIFKHISLDWGHMGHEPAGIFDVPHFDMHFYTVTESSLMDIMPGTPDYATKEAKLPDAKYVMANFAVPTPPGPVAVPMMGVHWIDSTAGIMPGTFSETMIMGSWNGKVTFIEPMITRAFLMAKTSVNKQLAQPQAYQISGYWPTTYKVSFDAATNEHVITLGGLTKRTAS